MDSHMDQRGEFCLEHKTDILPETNITSDNRLGPKRKCHFQSINSSGVNLLLVSGRVS